MKQIKTRKQAAADRDKKYYTGRKCGRGHDDYRYTASGVCVSCNSENCKDHYRGIKTALKSRVVKVPLRAHVDDVEELKLTADIMLRQRGLK